MSKINVLTTLGQGNGIGQIDAVVGMPTSFGMITSINGELLTSISGNAGESQNVVHYAHDTQIASGNAADYGWPNSGGSVVFGHGDTWPNGVPKASGNVHSIYNGNFVLNFGA